MHLGKWFNEETQDELWRNDDAVLNTWDQEPRRSMVFNNSSTSERQRE
jgi:hypothetical protein